MSQQITAYIAHLPQFLELGWMVVRDQPTAVLQDRFVLLEHERNDRYLRIPHEWDHLGLMDAESLYQSRAKCESVVRAFQGRVNDINAELANRLTIVDVGSKKPRATRKIEKLK